MAESGFFCRETQKQQSEQRLQLFDTTGLGQWDNSSRITISSGFLMKLLLWHTYQCKRESTGMYCRRKYHTHQSFLHITCIKVNNSSARDGSKDDNRDGTAWRGQNGIKAAEEDGTAVMWTKQRGEDKEREIGKTENMIMVRRRQKSGCREEAALEEHEELIKCTGEVYGGKYSVCVNSIPSLSLSAVSADFLGSHKR